MIAVIFEVIPHEGRMPDYLSTAELLKPALLKMKGFISIERFQSLNNPYKILSLSFWSDEDAVKNWRNLEIHRDAQSIGRNEIFKEYHLRIGAIIRDYGMFEREEAPTDSQQRHKVI